MSPSDPKPLINRSTTALLAAILLIAMGQEIWRPFIPEFIEETIGARLRGGTGPWGLSAGTLVLLMVGLFGTLADFQEGIYYYLGGRMGAALGTRKALIVCSLLPLAGYGLLLAWISPWAPFIAMPLVMAYDSFSQPAMLTVVGDTLKARHRTLAFSLQAIQRRIPRIVAYLLGGVIMTALTAVNGTRAAVLISAALVAIAVLVQVFLLHAGSREAPPAAGDPLQLSLLKRFPPALRRLLLADILARIAEGLPREFFILYAVADQSQSTSAGLARLSLNSAQFGTLIALQAFVSLMIYVPIGLLAARKGSKKPFIGLTFICFACFPLAFFFLGRAWGYVGLALAYVVAGLREIGEPARKAMITELVPQEARTAATGLYWSARSFSVMLAPLTGAILWITLGPIAPFIGAFIAGITGAVFFYLFFHAPEEKG